MKSLCNLARASKVLWVAGGMMIGAALTQGLHAQQGNIQRVVLLRADAPQSAPLELVMGTAEILAGTNAGKHSHPGIEMGYVLSGEAVMEVEGEAPRSVKAGDAYFIPTARVHDVQITSSGAAKVLAIYLVEKGKPLATAAQ